MAKTLGDEKRAVSARFDAADKVLSDRPEGLARPSFRPLPESVPKRSFSAESGVRQKGYLVTATMDRVHDNPLNARHIYKPEEVRDMAASLATHGQMVPATAIVHPTLPEHFLLIDGHYRKRGLAAGNQSTIELMVVEAEGDLELYRMSWLLNVERNAQSPLDNALAWRVMIDQGHVENEGQIAELLGISLPTVNKTMSLLKLPSSVVEKMREKPEKFGVFAGYELTLAARNLNESELTQLVERIIVEDLSSREVAAIRAKLESAGTRKRKESSRQYKIEVSGVQVGSLKEWDSGKVALEVVMTDPKDRAALVAELRTRFGVGE
jgi:ParB family chromosome partitioning protein